MMPPRPGTAPRLPYSAPMPADLEGPWPGAAPAWTLDPAVAFLNHGSFGACPREVLEAQSAWRARLERQPVAFLEREIDGLLAEAADQAAGWLGADPEGFAFVPNATTGVNTVLRHLALAPGDEVLMTDHAYPAVENTVRSICARAGATAVVHPIELPLPGDAEIVEGLLARVGPRTRLVVVEEVTSQTAAILPVGAIVAGCRARGVPTLVDAAHGPGMLPTDVRALGADFWTCNFHKWVCAPKGAGGLVVAPEHRERLRPLVISQPWLTTFRDAFAWTGTADPTAYLSVPAAIAFLEGLGLEALRARNHELALAARDLVGGSIGTRPLVPDDRCGWMTVVPLPEGAGGSREEARILHEAIYARAQVEVPIVAWKGLGLVRLSAHAYNRLADYRRLAEILPAVLAENPLPTSAPPLDR